MNHNYDSFFNLYKLIDGVFKNLNLSLLVPIPFDTYNLVLFNL